MNKCVFLDRDGVLNREIGEYAYRLDHFIVEDGVPEALRRLKADGYLLIVITNQAGISKGLYTEKDVMTCYNHLQERCDFLLNDIYFCPYHPAITNSLCRKPDSLMFERAIHKYNIDTAYSWMVGDSERDILPAKKLGMTTIQVGRDLQHSLASFTARGLKEAAEIILSH